MLQILEHVDKAWYNFYMKILVTPGRWQWKMLFTINERGLRIARHSVFDCHLSPDRPQIAIKNSISNDFWSTFVDSINIFDCRLPGVLMRPPLIQIFGKLESALLHHWVQLKCLKSGALLRISKIPFMYTFRPKIMGRFYHNSNRFLMVCVQKLCVEPILISLNPIFAEFVMTLVSPHHRHPLMICHQ